MTREQAINDVAARLGVPAQWLDALIRFESNYNPLAKNPLSSASGLIQFTDSTARSLGYGSATELVLSHPSFESQMAGPVLKYLSQFKPFPTKQSLYMAVFYPRYRDVPQNTAFPDSVKKVNPGINVVGDYIAKVEKKKLVKYSVFGFIIPIAAAALAVFFPTIKKEMEKYEKRGR